MTIKTNTFKVWIAHLAHIPILIAGFWIIGIPLKDPMLWLFLGIAFPVFTICSALVTAVFTSAEINEAGIRCTFPRAGMIPWDEVVSIRRQWPFLRITGNNGLMKLMPMKWTMKDPNPFCEMVQLLAETKPWARELMKKA